MKDVLIAVLGMGVLGIFWGVVLVVVNKKFHVEENPMIEKTLDLLPGANCGACGFAGCAAFADAIVEQNVDISLCPVCSPENIDKIAGLLGRTVDQNGPRMIATLFCKGSKEFVASRAKYSGDRSCVTEHITQGGTKSCGYGCLGHGDCVRVCPFDALLMGDDGLPKVDAEKCTGCNQCVEICPRELFKLAPEDQKLLVLCSSNDKGPDTKKACKVGCIGCMICAKKVDESVFKIENFLATADYEAAKSLSQEKCDEAVQKCPQDTIVKN